MSKRRAREVTRCEVLPLPRYSVDLTTKDAEKLKAIAAKEDRTLASMLRCLIRRQLQVGILLENGVNQRQNSKDIAQDYARAGTDSGKKKENRSQMAAGIAKRVVGRINALRPGGKGSFQPATYEPQISGLLKRGHTEMDMVTVVEWKAAECKRRNDWQWFKPATLLRVTKFAEKLDEALAGVEVGGQQPLPAHPDDALWDYHKNKPQPHERD